MLAGIVVIIFTFAYLVVIMDILIIVFLRLKASVFFKGHIFKIYDIYQKNVSIFIEQVNQTVTIGLGTTVETWLTVPKGCGAPRQGRSTIGGQSNIHSIQVERLRHV